MDHKTKGAWIIHHGRKISGTDLGAASYPTIDIAAKSGSLLARMAASDGTTLSKEMVQTLAKAGGLSTKTDLPACLSLLQDQKVIDVSASGGVAVIGITASSALDHTTSLFEQNGPEQLEQAALALGELVSQAPIDKKTASEKISDEFKIATPDVADFLSQSAQLGFIESDDDGANPLLFNGNLFRRDTVGKTKRVLDSLTGAEQAAFVEFENRLKSSGALSITEATRIFGDPLLSKLRAAAVFDENIVSNEAGDHSFITSPGAFHKFANPMVDDTFDHAKALVAALSYGIYSSTATRGQIWGVDLLLRKLLRGYEVGPAPAIGKDYRALELERVVEIRQESGKFYLKLLKTQVGEIALQVLQHGNAAASALDHMPSAQVTGYTGPDKARSMFRKRKDVQPTKAQMRSLLSSVRSGGGL